MLIKDEKQHLGFGDYPLKRYRAVVIRKNIRSIGGYGMGVLHEYSYGAARNMRVALPKIRTFTMVIVLR